MLERKLMCGPSIAENLPQKVRHFPRKLASLIHLLSLAFLVSWCAPAAAFDWWVDAKVTVIEPDYMPGWISLEISAAAGSCPAGTFLNYNAQGATASDKQANASAVLATLLTAQARNSTV